MADDFGTFPLDAFDDERLDGAPMWVIHGFMVIIGVADDYGRFDGRPHALASQWRCAPQEVSDLLAFLKDRKLVEFYEVPGRGGVPCKVGEIVDFFSYRGHVRRRKNESDRGAPHYPDRDGTMPSRRGHRPAPRPGQGEPKQDRVKTDMEPERTDRRKMKQPETPDKGATKGRQEGDERATEGREKGDKGASSMNPGGMPFGYRPTPGATEGRPKGGSGATKGREGGDTDQREIQTETETRGAAPKAAPSVIMSDLHDYEDRARDGGADASAPRVGVRAGPSQGTQPDMSARPSTVQGAEPVGSTAHASGAPAASSPEVEAKAARYREAMARARLLPRHATAEKLAILREAAGEPPRAPEPQPVAPVFNLGIRWPSQDHENAALDLARRIERRGAHRVQATLWRLGAWVTRPDFLAKIATAAAPEWRGWDYDLDPWDVLEADFEPLAGADGSSQERPVLEVLPGGGV